MAHVTIEYVIMIPLLLLQVFLFPLTASWLMDIWVNSRRTLALQDAASHLASTLQQLYLTLNHVTVPSEKVTYSPELPQLIEDFPYKANATLRTVLNPDLNSTKALELMVRLMGTSNKVTTTVLLGPNVEWQESVFVSNSTHASLTAEKFNGTISLRFEG